MSSLINISTEDLIKLWAPYILTLDQREQLVIVIDQLLSDLFKSDVKMTFDVFPTQFRLGLPGIEFPLKDYEKVNEISKFFEEVKNLLINLPVVELVLAFNPSTTFLATVLDQIRISRNDSCLIKYQYDPDILAGVVIKTDGRVEDYSLKRLIDIL